MTPHPHEDLYRQDVARRIYALNEDLGRHDENLGRYYLLAKCVPYFLREEPIMREELDRTYESVKHALPEEELRPEDRDRDLARDYYASNANERPFEEQYGIATAEAHRIPRIAWLIERLGAPPGLGREARILDLSANDAFMAARLALEGLRVDCLDLNPGNIKIALERKEQDPRIGRIEEGDLHDAPTLFEAGSYDAVVLFETVEHLGAPERAVATVRDLVKPGGHLYLSTPLGAVEQGNVPGWATVEPKGHVRTFTRQEFIDLAATAGKVTDSYMGPDRVMCAEVAVR